MWPPSPIEDNWFNWFQQGTVFTCSKMCFSSLNGEHKSFPYALLILLHRHSVIYLMYKGLKHTHTHTQCWPVWATGSNYVFCALLIQCTRTHSVHTGPRSSWTSNPPVTKSRPCELSYCCPKVIVLLGANILMATPDNFCDCHTYRGVSWPPLTFRSLFGVFITLWPGFVPHPSLSVCLCPNKCLLHLRTSDVSLYKYS